MSHDTIRIRRSCAVRQQRTRNLEIPGSMLPHRPGMTPHPPSQSRDRLDDRRAPRRQLICPPGAVGKFLSTLSLENISVLRKAESGVWFSHPASLAEGRIAIVTIREAGMRWTRTHRLTSGDLCGRRSRVVLARACRR